MYPDNADTIVNIASALIEMGKYDEAIAECNRALEIDPKIILPRSSWSRPKKKQIIHRSNKTSGKLLLELLFCHG